MFGGAVLRSVCRGQALIALSSAESEFYGCGRKGASQWREVQKCKEITIYYWICLRAEQDPRTVVWARSVQHGFVEILRVLCTSVEWKRRCLLVSSM